MQWKLVLCCGRHTDVASSHICYAVEVHMPVVYQTWAGCSNIPSFPQCIHCVNTDVVSCQAAVSRFHSQIGGAVMFCDYTQSAKFSAEKCTSAQLIFRQLHRLELVHRGTCQARPVLCFTMHLYSVRFDSIRFNSICLMSWGGNWDSTDKKSVQ